MLAWSTSGARWHAVSTLWWWSSNPTFNAVKVGVESAVLANDLGIETVHLVVNRTSSENDLERVLDYVDRLDGPPFSSVATVPYDEAVLLSEPSVEGLLDGLGHDGGGRGVVDPGAGLGSPSPDQGGLMRVVVIGTGPAGITAAEMLRRLDPSGTVVALSAEPFAPYSPPAMADHYLTGRDSTLYWKGRDVATRLGIDERREAQVTGIDADNREIVLADGQRVMYEGLVVASGSRLHAPLEGADLPGVLDFKSLRTADELVGRVRSGRGDERSDRG